MSLADELQKEPAKVFEAYEAAIDWQSETTRRSLAHYLISVASDLLRLAPHVHVKVERAVNPPLVCLSITRQLYPQNHPANDLPERPELFSPNQE